MSNNTTTTTTTTAINNLVQVTTVAAAVNPIVEVTPEPLSVEDIQRLEDHIGFDGEFNEAEIEWRRTDAAHQADFELVVENLRNVPTGTNALHTTAAQAVQMTIDDITIPNPGNNAVDEDTTASANRWHQYITTNPRPTRRVGGTNGNMLFPRLDTSRVEPAVEQLPQSEESAGYEESVDFFESLYGKKFRCGKKRSGKVVFAEPKIIEKEPDPINESEEVILNYPELTDTLVQRVMVEKYGIDWSEEENQDEYNRLMTEYETLVLKHKRKINV
jgi:hypothetical protein